MEFVKVVRIAVIVITFIFAVLVIKAFIESSEGVTMIAGIAIMGFFAFRIIVHNIRKLMKSKNDLVS